MTVSPENKPPREPSTPILRLPNMLNDSAVSILSQKVIFPVAADTTSRPTDALAPFVTSEPKGTGSVGLAGAVNSKERGLVTGVDEV